jgi:hypothetical protein
MQSAYLGSRLVKRPEPIDPSSRQDQDIESVD